MSQQSNTEIIESTAASWAARTDRGALGADEQQDLERWLAESVLHRGAYARCLAALEFANAQFMSRVNDHRRAQAAFSRRRALWLGGGATAAAAAASLAVMVTRDKPPGTVTYTARRGEIRLVSLSDGSIVTLDTSSTIAVDYQRKFRKVELVAGRALFTVAKDKTRPFIVSASGVKVQAVGTSFSVRNFSAAPIEVLVQEGVVEVGRTMSEKPVRVGANTKVLAPIARNATLNVVSVDPEAVSHELSWRQGVLAFEDITLAMAAMEFSRYSDTRIVFSDPQIGLVTISGLFSANNPEAFARAAAVSLGLKLTFRDGEIRLERR